MEYVHLRLKLQKFPSPRWENALPRWDFHMSRALCFQGGGVYVGSGTVSFSSCTITGNTATGVRAHAQKFPSPRWENGSRACFDSRLHNCDRHLGQLQGVRAEERGKFPSPPWETHVLLVFTGRRCLCLFRHRHNDVLLDHRQHSFWIGACSCGNFPSPRWENG